MRRILLPLLLAALLPLAPSSAGAAYADAAISTTPVTVPMIFPVIGSVSYSDTFLACRSGCTRKHFGQDLMGRKMQPLVAAFDGYVGSVKRESYVGEGNYFTIRGDKGWSVNYLHVNNDTPGTDDGRGTAKYAFAPGLSEGDRVFAGQLLGWLGDSGNAEGTGPHLHFELRKGDSWGGTVYNAIYSLNAAVHIGAPRTSGPHTDGAFVRSTTPGSPVWRIDGESKRRVAPGVLTALGFSTSQVVVVGPNEVGWYETDFPVPLPDGLAYRAPDGKIYFVTSGVRILVPATALADLGIREDRVRAVDYESVTATPRAPYGTVLPGKIHDGAVVRESGTTSMWWIEAGVRQLVPSWYTLVKRGRTTADVTVVPAGSFEPVVDPVDPTLVVSPGVPQGPKLTVPDGLQMRDEAGRRWIVTGGMRRQFPEPAAALYGWSKVAYARPTLEEVRRVPMGAALP